MTSSDDVADQLGESFDADSILKFLGEILNSPPTSSTTTSPSVTFVTSATQPLHWPTGGEASSIWTGSNDTVVVTQPATEEAAWTGNDVTVSLANFQSDFLSSMSPGSVPRNAADEVFDLNPFAPISSNSSGPNPVSMTTVATATQDATGILLVDVSESSLDGTSLQPNLFEVNSGQLWLLTTGESSKTVIASAVTSLTSPSLPLTVAQFHPGASEVDIQQQATMARRMRLGVRCLSDSEVILASQEASTSLLARQLSKRQKKVSDVSKALGMQRRITTDAGPSRTTITDEIDDVIAEARLHRRREQNRRAARVCRERKRAMSASMVKEYQDLLSSNTSLRYEIRQLQQEEQSLTTVLEKHLQLCTTMTSVSSSSSSSSSTTFSASSSSSSSTAAFPLRVSSPKTENPQQ